VACFKLHDATRPAPGAPDDWVYQCAASLLKYPVDEAISQLLALMGETAGMVAILVVFGIITLAADFPFLRPPERIGMAASRILSRVCTLALATACALGFHPARAADLALTDAVSMAGMQLYLNAGAPAEIRAANGIMTLTLGPGAMTFRLRHWDGDNGLGTWVRR